MTITNSFAQIMDNQHAIILRLVTMCDARLLHAWRNDPEARRASRHGGLVPWEDHLAWLSAILASPERVIANRRSCCVVGRSRMGAGLLRILWAAGQIQAAFSLRYLSRHSRRPLRATRAGPRRHAAQRARPAGRGSSRIRSGARVEAD